MTEAEQQMPTTLEKSFFWLELAGYTINPSWNNEGMYKGLYPNGMLIGIVNKQWIIDTAYLIWANYYQKELTQ